MIRGFLCGGFAAFEDFARSARSANPGTRTKASLGIALRHRQISRGDPFTPGGAIYVIRNQDDLLQMAVELEFVRLRKDGIPLAPLLIARIQDRVQRDNLLLHHKLSSQGVPTRLRGLLEIASKSHAEKYCRNLHFTEFDLFLLIHNCGLVGFNHQARFEEHIPDDRAITEDDREALNAGNLRPFTRKLVSLLKFRKQSHIHLFEHDGEWHLFYFTYSDTEEKGESHWTGGSHLHYISHLWTTYHKDDVLKRFDNRKSDISGYAHIRFSPFEYPEPLEHQDVPFTVFGHQPMLLAINADLPSDPNANPIPTAHIATRGVWVRTISVR